jgi:hypothetical protein
MWKDNFRNPWFKNSLIQVITTSNIILFNIIWFTVPFTSRHSLGRWITNWNLMHVPSIHITHCNKNVHEERRTESKAKRCSVNLKRYTISSALNGNDTFTAKSRRGAAVQSRHYYVPRHEAPSWCSNATGNRYRKHNPSNSLRHRSSFKAWIIVYFSLFFVHSVTHVTLDTSIGYYN